MGFYKDLGKLEKGNIDPVQAAMEQNGYLIEILHISSGKMAVFPSWITDFSDTYTSNWNSENIFGRNDPIGTFQNTSRQVSVSLSVPSFSVVEARENMHQLEHLIANLYPSYRRNARTNVDALYGSPLVKVKFANLIKNAAKLENAVNVAEGGLSGWISNVTFTPNLEAGMHHPPPNGRGSDYEAYNGTFNGTKNTNKTHTFIPKVIDISFNLSVVHEHKLGWNENQQWIGSNDPSTANFPYGIETISGGQHAAPTKNKGSSTTRRTADQITDAQLDQIFGGRGRV